jgi:hypothetical protein
MLDGIDTAGLVPAVAFMGQFSADCMKSIHPSRKVYCGIFRAVAYQW